MARTEGLEQQLLQALSHCSLIIRGPKPAAVLARLGLKYAVRAPEPNTWRELLQAIDNSGISLDGQPVAVQEYGVPNPQLYSALEQRGAGRVSGPRLSLGPARKSTAADLRTSGNCGSTRPRGALHQRRADSKRSSNRSPGRTRERTAKRS
ncbi:MAG UNVERIFIED_CONTAM: uroporphyrinogen-III synthase [Planctomycetaceae bacterium]